MMGYPLPFLLGVLSLFTPLVAPQTLESVYWTPIVGQPQTDSSRALLVPNGTTGASIFHPSAMAGPVDVTTYDVASQQVSVGAYTSSFALPAGAAVAQVPPDSAALARYKAYAYGGTVTGPTGVSTTLSTWLGFDGVSWVPLVLSNSSSCLVSLACNYPRELASAVFLSNCDSLGSPCVLVVGGRTPGIPMSTQSPPLGIMRLNNLNALTPALNPITTYSGAESIPTPRHSMSASASPDGTIAFFFGGAQDDGSVLSDLYALNMQGWTTALNAVPKEMSQIITNTGPGFVTAKNYPCQTVREVSQCCSAGQGSAGTWGCGTGNQNLGCWGPGSKWNGYGAGTPDVLDLSVSSGTCMQYGSAPSSRANCVVNSVRCDGFGSCNNIGWAYNAIDGNTDGTFCSGSVSRSNTDGGINYNYPLYSTWTSGNIPTHLRIDLQTVRSKIQQIYLYWRTDCCLSRTGGFQVWVGNDGTRPDAATNTQVVNPFSDAVLSPTVLSVNDLSGRYVFVALPGQQRVLGVAEIQVYVRKMYTWRKLNGLVNVAAGATVVQSSADSGTLSTTMGPPDMAVDTLTTTVTRTSGLIYAGNPLAGKQYLLVDLGAEYSVVTLQYLSGSTRSGSANIGRNLMVSMGLTTDLAQATPCTPSSGLDTSTAAFTGATPRTISTCTGSARYIHVWKLPSTSGTAAIAGQQNTISVTELNVFAEKLRFLPEARRGASSTTFGKYMVIHGGYRYDYTTCADLRFFDMVSMSWLPDPPKGLLGNPPPSRAYSSLLTLPSTFTGVTPAVNQIAVFGGENAIGSFNDFFLANIPACPPLSLAGVSGSLVCGSGGLSCSYTCLAGYTASNTPTRISCQVNGGWDGILPICAPTSTLLPSAPTLTNVVPGAGDGTAVVSWDASTVTNGPLVNFMVTPTSSDSVDRFSGGYASLAPYTWYNGDIAPQDDATNSYLFANGVLQIQAYVYDNTASGSVDWGECTFGHQMCPFFLRNFPTSVAGLSASTSFAIESLVSFTPQGKVYPISEQLVGIGVYDTSRKDTGTFSGRTVKRTGAFQVFAGLRVFQAGCNTRQLCTDQQVFVGMKGFNSAGAYNWWVPTANSFPTPGMVIVNGGQPAISYYSSAYVRLERDEPNKRWRMGYKFQANQQWIYSPYVSDAALLWGGALVPASSKVAMLVSNSNQWNRGLGTLSYLRIATLSSISAGFSTNATTSPVIVTGLTPGQTYSFTVQAANALGLGAASAPYPAAGFSVPASSSVQNYVSSTLVAVPLMGLTAALSSTGSTGSAASALDGAPATYFITLGTEPRGDWWRVDLGIVSAVKEISITNAPTGVTNRLSNFRVLVGTSSDWQTAVPCDPASVPPTIALGATVRFPCAAPTSYSYNKGLGVNAPGIVGRYVFVQALASVVSPILALADVQVWVNNTCSRARPLSAGATQVPGTVCAAGAKYGAVCVQNCVAGWAAVSGTTATTCNGQEWNDKPLICTPLCGTRGVPNLASKCTQSLYRSDFFDATQSSVWGDLRVSPPGLSTTLTVSGGYLQASARLGSNDEVVGVALAASLQTWRQSFSWQVLVTPSSDRLGIVWRAQDAQNYYRAVVNPLLGVHTIERMLGGVLTVLTSAPLALSPGVPFTLAVDTPSYNLNLFNVSINGVPLMATVDASFAVGAAGVYAATTGLFTSMAFLVDCTGVGCSAGTVGNTCQYDCSPGLTKIAPNFVTCLATGGWSTGNWTQCILDPPLFSPATLTMRENAPVKTLVGSPLQASLKSPDFQLSYSIIQQFRVRPENSSAIPQTMWPFAVDSCSGQVSVLSQVCSGGPYCWLFNYEDPNYSTFVISVRVSTNGPATFTQKNVTILVTNLVEPPFCAGAGGGALSPDPTHVQSLSLVENPSQGVLATNPLSLPPATVATYTGDAAIAPSQLRFSLVVDTTGGLFSMNYTTGQLSVSPSVPCVGGPSCFFNYEVATSRQYQLTARVTSIPASPYDLDGSLYGNCALTVTLVDANDPPTFTSLGGGGLFVTIAEQAASVGTKPTTGAPLDLGLFVPSGPGLFDEDYLPVPTSSGAFATTPLQINQILPTDPAYTPACGVPAPPLEYPTDTGLVSGVTLFASALTGASPLVTGNLKLKTRPGSGLGGWSNNLVYPPFFYSGYLLRKAWRMCINVSDGVYSAAGPVQILMIADAPSLPIITGFSTTTLPTLGGSILIINGTSLGNSSARYVANASFSCGSNTALTTPGGLPPYCTRPLSDTSYTVYNRLPMTCKILVNDTALACITPRGQGMNMQLSLTVNYYGQQYLNVATALTASFSFSPPTVTSVTGNTGLSTVGGLNQFINFTGSGFGTQYRISTASQTVAARFPNTNCEPQPGFHVCGPIVTWSNTLTGTTVINRCASSTAVVRSALNAASAWSALDTFFSCTAPAGNGAAMPWTLWVGGQTVTGTDPTTFVSYDPPTVISVRWGTGVVSSSLNTLGGQPFTVTGTNFGPAFSVVTALVGTWAANCSTHTQTVLRCVTGGGMGTGLYLTVNAGGQLSSNSLGPFSFKPILITSVSGPGAKLASTDGGEFVYIGGSGFGPKGLVPPSIVYGNKGPTGYMYTAVSCVVTVADVTITCLTAPGVGAGHAWLINGMGGSKSNGGVMFPAATSYAPPTVYSFLPSPQATMGAPGDTLLITGRNFGPPDAYTNTLLAITLNGVLLGPPLLASATVTAFGFPAKTMQAPSWSASASYSPGDVVSTPTGRYICVAGGVSDAANVPATLGSGVVDNTVTWNWAGTTATDTACTIMPSQSVLIVNGTSVVFQGVNASSGAPSSNSSAFQSQSVIQCALPTGTGANLQWTLTLDGQASTGPTTSYAPPVISAITDVAGNPVLNSLGNGGNNTGEDLLIITGQFFGPTAYNTTGLPLIQNISYGPATHREYNLPPDRWTLVDDSRILVRTLPGFGSGNQFLVSVADQTAPFVSAPLFDYKTPIVTSVSPNEIGTFSPTFSPVMITATVMFLNLNSIGGAKVGVTVGDVRSNPSDPTSPYVNQITPILPSTPAAIAAATNPDGSINITFPAPSGAGVGRAVRVYLCIKSTVTGDCAVDGGSTLLPNTLLTYTSPTLSTAVVSSLLSSPMSTTDATACPVCASTFLPCTPNAQALLSTLAPVGSWACPPPLASPVNPSAIYATQVTVTGVNLGGEVSRDVSSGSLTTPPTSSATDGAVKTVMILSSNTSGVEVWSDVTANVYSWVDGPTSVITLLLPLIQSSVLKVQITSTPSFPLAAPPITLSATLPFGAPNPQIIGVTNPTAAISVPPSPLVPLNAYSPTQYLDVFLSDFAWALLPSPTPSYYTVVARYGNPLDATPAPLFSTFGGSPPPLDLSNAPFASPLYTSMVQKARLRIPSSGQGSGVGIVFNVFSRGANVFTDTPLVSSNMSVNWPLNAVSYQPPSILSVVVKNATWTQPGDPPCPWESSPSPNPFFTCTSSPLYQFTINGLNFGPPPRPYRQCHCLALNTIGTFNDTIIAAANWSDTTIQAYSPYPTGVVQVCIQSTDYFGNPNTPLCGQINIDTSLSSIISFSFTTCATVPSPGPCTIGGVAGPFYSSGLTAYSPSGALPGPFFAVTSVSNVDFTDQALRVGLYVPTGSSNTTEAYVEVPACVRFPVDGVVRCPGEPTYASFMQAFVVSNTVNGVLRDLVFQIPSGQGSSAVYIRRTLSTGVDLLSLSSYTITYLSPSLTGAAVTSTVPTTPATYFAITLRSSPRVTVPCDTVGGGISLALNGTNLGIYPVVTLGDGWICSISLWRSTASAKLFSCTFLGATPAMEVLSPLVDCSPTPGTYSCWMFTPPRGTGSGPGINGYTLAIKGGSFASNTAPFGYTLPTISSITSASGRFPTTGGILVTLTGKNFGFDRPDKVGSTRVTIKSYSPFLPTGQSGNMEDLCEPTSGAPVTRVSDSIVTCQLKAGVGAGLTVRVNVDGTASASPANKVIGDSDTPSIFSYDSPFFSATATYTVSGVSTSTLVLPSTMSKFPLLRGPTVGGSVVVIKGGNFGVRPPLSTLECLPNPICASCIPSQQNWCSTGASGSCVPTPSSDLCLPCLASDDNVWCNSLASTSAPGCTAQGANLSVTCPSVFAQVTNATQCPSVCSQGTLTAPISSDFSNCPSQSLCRPPPYCVFLMWANRPLGSPYPICNNAEDFLGEGEVPYTSVSSWTDSSITLTVPEGLGLKEVYVSVRGSVLAVDPGVTTLPINTPVYRNSTYRLFFAYNAPVIFNITPSVVNTDGSSLVTVFGDNFGPALYNTSAPLATRDPFSFSPSFPLSVAPTLPSAYTAVVFFKSCASATQNMANQVVGTSVFSTWFGLTDLRQCSNLLVSRSHTTLTFYAPPGIGRNKNVQVITVDGATDTPYTAVADMSSASSTASYVPPEFLKDMEASTYAFVTGSLDNFGSVALPNIYGGGVLTINGRNFGDPNLAISQSWSVADTQVVVKVNGLLCGVTCTYDSYPFSCQNTTHLNSPPGPKRSTANPAYNQITCGLNPSTPAGFADVEVVVADNKGVYRNNTGVRWQPPFQAPPFIVCKGSTSFSDYGYFGRMNETCLPCPKPAGWSTPGAICPGFALSSPNPLTTTTPSISSPAPCSLLAGCNIAAPGDSTPDCLPVLSPSWSLLPSRYGPEGIPITNDNAGCAKLCMHKPTCLGYTYWDPIVSATNPAPWAGWCYLRENASLPVLFNANTGALDLGGVSPSLSGSFCGYKKPFISGKDSPYPTLNAYNLAKYPDAWPVLNSLMMYPIPKPYFFNLNGSMASACPPSFGTPGRDVCIVPCQPNLACLGGNKCELGYASNPPMFRCSSCDLGYFRSGTNCIKCPDSPYTTLVLVVVLLIFLAGFGFWLNKHQVNIAVLSIGVDYFQVLAILTSAPIQWPPILAQLWRFMSAFNLNIEIVAPECLVPNVAFQTKWLIVMAVPLGLMALMGAQFMYLYAFKRVLKGHRDKRKLCSHYPTLVSSFLVLMYLFYLYMTKTVLDIFNCIPTSPPDGNLYLAVTFEKCTVPMTGSQAALVTPALLGLGFYTFGYPFYVASNLYRSRELVMEDQLLRAKGVGNDKLTNPNAFQIRRTFGRTYYQFKPQWYLWILAILARKLFIAVTSIIFSADPSFQMAACLLIMFLAFSAQVQVRPYLCAAENEGVLKENALLALAMPKSVYAKLQGRLANVASLQKKQAKPSVLFSKGRVNTTALVAVVGKWLMNYNTMEAIMLFSGVVVSLLFLLYISTLPSLSNVSTVYADSRDMIVNALLATIILSILYYFSVVILEISTMVAAARASRLSSLKARPISGGKALSGDDALRNANRFHEDELTTGGMDTQQNPLLLRAGSLNLGKKEKSDIPSLTIEARQLAEGLVELEGRIPAHLWPAFQATFAQVVSVSNEIAAATAETKKRIQDTKLNMGNKKRSSTTAATSSAPSDNGEEGEGENSLPSLNSPTLPSQVDDPPSPQLPPPMSSLSPSAEALAEDVLPVQEEGSGGGEATVSTGEEPAKHNKGEGE